MEIIIESNAESNIQIYKDDAGNLIIKKTYRAYVPVIRFLNEYLRPFYAEAMKIPDDLMAVVAHEYFILKALEPYNIAPKVLSAGKDCLYMTFEGNSILHADCTITESDFRRQAKNILHILHRLGIRHNDLLPQNVLIRDCTVKIIDFTLADYGKIDIVANLPDRKWARLNQDYNLINYEKFFPKALSGEDILRSRAQAKEIAGKIYNYHNLGVNNFNETEPEKTPHGSGERYNFDRMAMMVMNYDFYNKNVIDLGCNSGWFLFQISTLGANKIVGVDYEFQGIMGQSVRYARTFANQLQTNVSVVNQNIETLDLSWLAYNNEISSFDAALILSVLHHIKDKENMMYAVFKNVAEIIFYEDHEFWNELYDDNDNLIEVQGSGYKFDWNKDLSWQEKMASLSKHEPLVLEAFRKSWRREVLQLEKYSKVKLLGFSEKRRPLLALYK